MSSSTTIQAPVTAPMPLQVLQNHPNGANTTIDNSPADQLARHASTRSDSSPDAGGDSADVEHSASLPPTDGGKAAWLVLASCSLIQAPVWGFSLAFGVFQDYYTGLEEFRGSQGSIAVIGTTATGILYLLSPFTFTILTRYPHLRPWFLPVGLVITTVAILLSSFSTQVWQLIATQGVLGGVGGSLLFSPTTLYMEEWFVRRKGLAYGVMWAAKNITGIVMPFVVSKALDRFGFRTVLRAWAVGVLILTLPLLKTLRPRLPLPPNRQPRPLNLSFLRLPLFWTHQTGNVLQSLGYFLPATYLSSYANRNLRLPPIAGPSLLAALNVASIPGGIAFGILGDRQKQRSHAHSHGIPESSSSSRNRSRISNTNISLSISTLGSAIAVFVFWGLSGGSQTARTVLVSLFAVLYGFFAGGFSTIWSTMVDELASEQPALETGLVFGLLAGGRGIGNVVSGPVSSALLQDKRPGGGSGSGGGVRLGYDSEYEPLIVFTGITALLGGWAWGSNMLVKGVQRCGLGIPGL